MPYCECGRYFKNKSGVVVHQRACSKAATQKRKTDTVCIEGVFWKGAVRAIHYSLDCCIEKPWLITDNIDQVTCKRCLRRRQNAMIPRRPSDELPTGVKVNGGKLLMRGKKSE